ncbi:MAG TPA: helix-turn-helix transcriptional regulator [Thermodesulfovibrionales bacterium]|nr:helix-turn-helix transcriptional regulator [Thermodesulfovibrionales bacterium]
MTPEELTQWRERSGYSQIQLANALGVTNVCISRWENGARKIPAFLHLALRCLELEGGELHKVKGKKKSSTYPTLEEKIYIAEEPSRSESAKTPKKKLKRKKKGG